MRYGYFDDQKKEYVIERPDTPQPWINYLGERSYFGIISNTAGGYSFYRDARLRRILRYRYNNIPQDEGGRYLYIRFSDGDFFSPTWQPVRKNLDFYQCRHGLGYTIISSRYRDIECEITYFVPIDEELEIWSVKLFNRGKDTLELDIFSFVEFCLWNALDDSTNFQRNLNIGEVEVEEGIIYHITEYRERRNHYAFFGAVGNIVGFETDRESFLGPYGSLSSPYVVREGKTSNSIACGWAPVGVHQIKIALPSQQEDRVLFLLGYKENLPHQKFITKRRVNKEGIPSLLQRFADHDEINQVLEKLKLYWKNILDRFQVQTPNSHFNRMINVWNQYQCMITFNLSRSASYFESGISRGIGFRDSNQDLMGFVHLIPDKARERLLDLSSTQFQSGGAYHQYQPLTRQGNDEIGAGFNDDPLWLVLAAASYLKETGDFTILNEMVPFADGGNPATFYQHLLRSLDYTLHNLGPHGLPLIGQADWNDCLNLNLITENEGKIAESILIGEMFVAAGKELAQIAEIIGKPEDASRFREETRKMIDRINQWGWDGEWYLRAYDDRGLPVGSKQNQEGKIFLETQPWAVMSGVADLERGMVAMDSVEKFLATPYGIILQQPAFTQFSFYLGECTSYPPGLKENAGIFCHPNPWAIIAECILRRAEKAWNYWLTICPSRREEISEVHRQEPYVYAQMIAGPDHPRFGEAKNSWLTGTASWALVASTQWILGIRPDYQGLIIDPCIPTDWKDFRVQRWFRGVQYTIVVERKPNVKYELKVDGKRISGKTIPIFSPGSEHRVEVILGED
ncbi:MAG: glycosyl transferase [Candidatus Atribacteria bacterium]|nr:glycosyl transferase [Candidatus Atribacteria bacterium]